MAKKAEPDCLFCSIVRGEVPVSIVHETDSILALMDIQLVNPGHVLVIARGQTSYLADLPDVKE